MQSSEFQYSKLASESWFKSLEMSSIWLSGYRAVRVRPNDLAEPCFVEFQNTRAVILRGTLSYLDTSNAKIELISDDKWTFDQTNIKEKRTVEGVYCLIVAPFDQDGTAGVESITRDRIRETVAILASVLGKSVAYQHLFDNILRMQDNSLTGFSPALRNPLSFPEVRCDNEIQSRLTSIASAISDGSCAIRNRIAVALHWFEKALYEIDGTTSFIDYWIAIETLAMPDSTNISQIRKLLSKAYKMNLSEIDKTFQIGRIFNLRSKILHDGNRVPINSFLLDYLEALFSDLLEITLGLDCRRRAKEKIESNISELLFYFG